MNRAPMPRETLALTLPAFRDWLRGGRSRTPAAIYYEGSIWHDVRTPSLYLPNGTPIFETNYELLEIAEEARKAYRAGMVELVQRRIGDGEYQYIAQRTRRQAHGR